MVFWPDYFNSSHPSCSQIIIMLCHQNKIKKIVVSCGIAKPAKKKTKKNIQSSWQALMGVSNSKQYDMSSLQI